MMRRQHLIVLQIILITMIAAHISCCGVARAEQPAEKLAVPDSGYLIGPGDILGLEVWKDPNLTRTMVVLSDGRIVIPLIGELMAGGRSVESLRKEIKERLDTYVPNATLTLEVKQVNSMFIYVLGRVNNPGRPQLNGNVNVLQALAMAGGLNPFAKRSDIKIFRLEEGKTRIIPFNYDEVTSGERIQDNIELKRGDVLFIP